MLTEKDYCDYETCVALKKLGYKEKTLAYYTSEGIFYWRRAYIYDVAIPDLAKSSNKELYKHVLDAVSLYEAQKFLREEKGIFVYIDVPWKADDGLGWSYFCCNKPMTEEDKEVCFASGGFYDSYEEALAEGLRKAVKIFEG